jgi:hypothetical protein
MSERYYSTSDNYPYVIKSILERVILYFQNVIYPDESLTDSRKRFIIADTSDDGNAIRRSIDFFKNSNGTFPFTAYNIQDDAPGEFKSHLQVSGKVYSELVGGYISFIPMILNIPMVTYYTTPFDFWRGMTIFAEDEANFSRLDTPVIINGVTCSMTIDLTYTTERGSLAFSIEEHFGEVKFTLFCIL